MTNMHAPEFHRLSLGPQSTIVLCDARKDLLAAAISEAFAAAEAARPVPRFKSAPSETPSTPREPLALICECL